MFRGWSLTIFELVVKRNGLLFVLQVTQLNPWRPHECNAIGPDIVLLQTLDSFEKWFHFRAAVQS